MRVKTSKQLMKVQFPNSVPVTVLLDRTSKFRRQVKQARLPKWPLHWMGLHIYYNGFTSTVRKYGQDFEFGNYPNVLHMQCWQRIYWDDGIMWNLCNRMYWIFYRNCALWQHHADGIELRKLHFVFSMLVYNIFSGFVEKSISWIYPKGTLI